MQKILRTIFLLYIFLFPFQLISFLSVFKNMFSSSAAIGNDFFVLIIGLLLIVIVDGGKIYFETGSIVRQGVKLVFELLIIGIITSIILFFPLGTLYGENSITASFSQNIYLVVTGITFYFNFRLFKCLSKKDIEKVLDFLCVFMTVLGIVQVLIILSFPAVGSFYDSVDIFGLLPNSNYMTKMHRICLSSSEPSGIGHIVGVLLLPYVLGQIIDGERKYKNRYCLWGILLVVISFFSFSSTVYASILIDLIVFIFLKIKGKKGAIFLFVVFVLCLLGFFLWDEVLVNTYFGKQMNYLLLEKTTDSSNLSTSYRYSTVINDCFCFLRYPFSGIGNGNQGFLYNETMSMPFIGSEVRLNYQTARAMSGSMGVVNGGPFTPAFISGYGLIGVFLLIRYLSFCNRKIRKFKEQLGCFCSMYYIGGIAFLLTAIVSGGIEGNFLVLFVCSIPMMADVSHNGVKI